MNTTHFTVELPLGELLECAAVAGRFVDPDERVETGNVWLTADGGHRTLAGRRIGGRRRDPRRRSAGSTTT